MRKYVLPLGIFLVMLFSGVASSPAASVTPTETVINYFDACRNGDVNSMKKLMAGNFYEKKHSLLFNNKNYPEFLKSYYQDLNITIVSASTGNFDMVSRNHSKLYERFHKKGGLWTSSGENDIAVITVSFEFPDKSAFISKFLLKKVSNNHWKIFEHLLE